MLKQPCLSRWLCVLLPFVLGILCQAEPASPARQSISLNTGWEFRQRLEGPGVSPSVWRPAQVPGVVHTDLLRNGLIPDPFFRSNESRLQWIENGDWEYRTSFQATPEVLKHRNIELVFAGLDTCAEVYLNDTHVLTANNMFREWRIDVKPHLKPGTNQLLVVFPSPIKEARKLASTDIWHPQIQTPEKSYLRKAAYEYGWDWGPRFVLSGIWRPVKLDVWDDVKIANLHVRQRDVRPQVAHLVVEAEVTAAADVSAVISVDYVHGNDKGSVSRNVVLSAGTNHIDMPIDVVKPDLWYPTGYGAQPMYKFDAHLRVGKQVEDETTVRTGLRSVVLRREVDEWGRSFEIVVNGIPIFGKGADVIPFDSFPTRVTTAQYRQILQSAKDANMNMIRHWGGGYYETDEFYDICDELGIMIWQDFMFGNEWQPGTYAFRQNVTQEAEHQVRRLREHPSIVLWCGNNETEASWTWGSITSVTNNVSPETRRRMWQDYLTLFSGVLARTVERLTPEVPYWPSSPSADYEDVSENYQSGDMHNWSIWHGMLNFRDYEKFFPRFMTEYGFQSFPEMRTVEAFTLPEDRTGILTPVMLAHQKNTSGNAKIHDYMLRDYQEPKDFATFLYVSQVLQAEGLRIGTEHLRRIRPRTMGALYWQLNDCWPVASWSSIDYYGRWKALHYYARRFYNDLLVSPHEENGGLAVYVVSDRTAPTAAELRVRLMGFDGTVLNEAKQGIQVTPLSSKIYLQLPLGELLNSRKIDPTRIVAAAELLTGGKVVSSNLLYVAPTDQIHLPTPHITTDLAKTGESYRLHVTSNVLARTVYVSFGDLDVKLTDNYFDLLPGQTLDIGISSTASLEQLRATLSIMSLADAFAPNGAAEPANVSGKAGPNGTR
jgi:beta-mannosidase